MEKPKNLSLPVVLIALLLVGCSEPQITREEAIALATQIGEHYASDDFALPTKFSASQMIKETVSSTQRETVMSQDLDYELKYLHTYNSVTTGSQSNKYEQWIYYELDDDKTYFVAEENNVKYRMEAEGDLFTNTFDQMDALFLLEETYGEVDFIGFANLLEGADTRNVYRSKGEGNLYAKVYIASVGPNAYGELEIANYLITMIRNVSEGEILGEFLANYSQVTINKPNLADYQLFTV